MTTEQLEEVGKSYEAGRGVFDTFVTAFRRTVACRRTAPGVYSGDSGEPSATTAR